MSDSFLNSLYKYCFLPTLLASFFVAGSVAQAAELFSDGFESNDFSLWDESGANWDAVSGAANAHEGDYRADGGGGTSAVPLAKYVSTAGYTDVTLSYWYRLPVGNLEEGDSFLVEYTTDSGASWVPVREYTLLDETAAWTEEVLALPVAANDMAAFGVRFRPNTSALSEEMQLDSVLLSAEELVVTFDVDSDGVTDAVDNCMNTPNPDQVDFDGDGTGDVCDPDLDDDGVPNSDENNGCVYDVDPACGEVVESDTDGDGVADAVDNCPHVPNVHQANFDGDEQGDACDPDDDNDGINDDQEQTDCIQNADSSCGEVSDEEDDETSGSDEENENDKADCTESWKQSRERFGGDHFRQHRTEWIQQRHTRISEWREERQKVRE